MRLGRVAFFLAALAGSHAFGQALAFDSSGDSMLSGNYYFREVAWVASASSGGSLSEAIALYGNINFTGTGAYTINAQYLDGAQGTITAETITGTYSIGAGGFGYLSHPLSSGAFIRGAVSNGIFIGSASTAGTFNDLFIAGQIPTPTPTLSSFNGSYAMSYVNYSDSSVGDFEDAQFTLNPTGSGALGTVSIRGYYAGSGSTVTGQQSAGMKYIASGGAYVVQFPTTSAATLVAGNEYLYSSPDGNFVFGGSPNQFDMLVGVRTTTSGAPQLLSAPLYYNAGVYSDATQIASGYLDLNTYYGSFNVSNGNVIQHQQLFSVENGSYSYVSYDSVPTTAGATYNDPSTNPVVNYTVGNGGNVRIGFGDPPYLGLDIALAAPTFSGSGVYLNPTGVVNAASYAPFTAGLSPGELVVLTGTNLASGRLTVASTATFPTTLNNVKVLIDGIAAPLYYVSLTQIAALVPYATATFGLATIQVNNNGVVSNIVTEYMNTTTPGIFTNPANGIGLAAAVHNATGSLVTEASPAQPGESISVYLTGLGTVFPPVGDGVPPTTTSATISTVAADISGTTATVTYAGLSSYAGLYQMNITVPTGLTAGDNVLDISGPDSYSSEAVIAIGSGTAAAIVRPEIQNGQAQKAVASGSPDQLRSRLSKTPPAAHNAAIRSITATMRRPS